MPEPTPQSHPSRSGKSFLAIFLIGLAVGVIVGWCCRPPSSFPIEKLKAATEEKFSNTKDQARQELADFAERLANKLRENKIAK